MRQPAQPYNHTLPGVVAQPAQFIASFIAPHSHNALCGRAAVPVAGFLFSWGLDANYRLGRTGGAGGDAAFPQVTLAQLQVRCHIPNHKMVETDMGRLRCRG